jgi:3-deoxy-D-manno-octulosonate 8-phosphate phosphatase (KDO 8-P phosphatase)
VAIVTGRESSVVKRRAAELGITEIYQKVTDKGATFKEILTKNGLSPEETAYAGDDLVDLPILLRCALPMAPADASPEILSVARFVSRSPGGHGAVREMIEYVLTGVGLWDDLFARYLA